MGELRSAKPSELGTVAVTLSSELEAYLPVSILWLHLNGELAVAPVVGGVRSDAASVPEKGTKFVFDVSLSSSCRTTPSGAFRTGMATADLALTAHIAGTASDPAPAKLSVRVDCDALAKQYPITAPIKSDADSAARLARRDRGTASTERASRAPTAASTPKGKPVGSMGTRSSREARVRLSTERPPR